ncbi:MAG: hypothetical protein ACXWQO_08485 [Bdellovibrionota bacterium]
MLTELRYYFLLFKFRFREPFTDFRATAITYTLFCFFIWLLSLVWMRYHSVGSQFSYPQVFLYVGVTELFFMTFLSPRFIASSTEDFALFLARPRSWVWRELTANFGSALGKRILFGVVLIVFSFLLRMQPEHLLPFLCRLVFLLAALGPAQALLVALFSSLRLSFPQTDYFVLPFSKVFLSLGGVFGPLSDYGEPWRGIFLQLPGSDLFFQPAYFVVHGTFYETSFLAWFLRLLLINFVLSVLLAFFYLRGRRVYQAWGG